MTDRSDMGLLTPSQARANAWLSWITAGVALTGAQLISPSLPAMKADLELTEPELALVMSVYLLPGSLAAIPVGLAADRFGRRRVLGSALVLFGLCGVGLLLSQSFELFLAIRFIQGIAFAGLLPLSMTVLGDIFRGAELVGSQGKRAVAMSIGDSAFPVLGGLLVTIAWKAPWAGQLLAIPVGLLVLTRLVDIPVSADSPRHKRLRAFLQLFRSGYVIALQYAGFLRMFLKFAILTFLPVHLVDNRGASAAFAGLAVGLSAFAGTAIAAFSGRIARLGRPTWLVGAGVVAMGLALGGMTGLEWRWMVLVSACVYGAGDGLLGVFINSFTTAATGQAQRAGFVAATGAVRNFAKFAAPSIFATLAVVLSMESAFLLLAAVAVASAGMAALMKPLEERLASQSLGTV